MKVVWWADKMAVWLVVRRDAVLAAWRVLCSELQMVVKLVHLSVSEKGFEKAVE